MATVDVSVVYSAVLVLTIVFTGVSIWRKEEVHFKALAGICWFIFGFVHFIAGEKDDILTPALAFFWFGVGLIFTIWGIASFFDEKKEKRLSFTE